MFVRQTYLCQLLTLQYYWIRGHFYFSLFFSSVGLTMRLLFRFRPFKRSEAEVARCNVATPVPSSVQQTIKGV